MRFRVKYDNQIVTTADDIKAVYESTKLNECWLLANQSIYGDILMALQREEYLRDDLSISVVSTDSWFHIDLDDYVVETESKFNLVTSTSVNNTMQKLELASFQGTLFTYSFTHLLTHLLTRSLRCREGRSG